MAKSATGSKRSATSSTTDKEAVGAATFRHDVRKYFAPFLYQNPAFDAFDDFSDFVESISCETSKSCQVRGSSPRRGAILCSQPVAEIRVRVVYRCRFNIVVLIVRFPESLDSRPSRALNRRSRYHRRLLRGLYTACTAHTEPQLRALR